MSQNKKWSFSKVLLWSVILVSVIPLVTLVTPLVVQMRGQWVSQAKNSLKLMADLAKSESARILVGAEADTGHLAGDGAIRFALENPTFSAGALRSFDKLGARNSYVTGNVLLSEQGQVITARPDALGEPEKIKLADAFKNMATATWADNEGTRYELLSSSELAQNLQQGATDPRVVVLIKNIAQTSKDGSGTKGRVLSFITLEALQKEIAAQVKAPFSISFPLEKETASNQSDLLVHNSLLPFGSNTDDKSIYVTLVVPKAEALKDVNRSTLLLIIACVAVVLIVTYIGSLLSKKLARPIAQTQQLAEAYQAGAYLQPRQYSVFSEIDNLLKTFFNLGSTIKSHLDNLSAMVNQGRLLASQVSLPQLAQQIQESFRDLTHIADLNVKVGFHRSCYLTEENLAEGFYATNTGGHSAALFQSSPHMIHVKDPKTQNELALISVTGLEEHDWEAFHQVLLAMGNNIASAINTVRLEQTMILVEQRNAEIRTVFSTITQGICTVGADLRISREYSKHLETILFTENLGGRDFISCAFSQSDVSGESLELVKTCLTSTIGESLLAFETNSGLLPREFQRQVDGVTQWLEIDWTPLSPDNETCSRIMLTLRDVTQVKALQAKAEENRKEMERIYQILSIPAEKFEEFALSAQELIAASRRQLHNIDEIKRNIHTIKGLSRLINFSYLSECAHTVEDNLKDTLKQYATGDDNQKGLCEAAIDDLFVTLKQELDRYVSLARQKLKRDSHPRKSAELRKAISSAQKALMSAEKIDRHTLEDICLRVLRVEYTSLADMGEQLQAPLPQIAKLGGKPCPVLKYHFNQDALLSSEASEVLNTTFAHLLSNSIDHGFGTDAPGRIDIDTQVTSLGIIITYQDNGAGLDLNSLKNIAKQKQLDLKSDDDLAHLVFDGGVSTASQVTQLSGRGMGMNAVKTALEKLEGRIELQWRGEGNQQGRRPIQFVVYLGSEHVVSTIPPNMNQSNKVA